MNNLRFAAMDIKSGSLIGRKFIGMLFEQIV